ncbi:acylneuraminate cytidylyltransferase family protein [Polynucleobacter paneuropaeus]|jgi:N-acylneuraminate cytidylyltransferase|nr:acylneuraminate cytidylyltransferase family protein [Polynucleobacter paneuropaeus]
MNKVIALIPARAGSKGVPNKNIRNLGGYPLIAWSIMAAKKSKLIDRVIVSTDSQEYAKLAIKFGAEVPFLRPSEISGDRSTDYDCIAHALDWLGINGGEPQYIVHIRPTTPFRDPSYIDLAIETFQKSPINVTALRSAHEMSESAYKTFEITTDGRFKRVGSEGTALDSANNARQQFPNTYQANGYVDILSTSFIRENDLIHGDWVLPFITPRVHEVDAEDDFFQLEYQLSHSPNIASQLFN